jgi:hypothetical protein
VEHVYSALRVLARALAVVLIFTPVALIALMIWLDLTAPPRSPAVKATRQGYDANETERK